MHIHKLPSGKWRVIVKHQGQQRTGTAITQSEAKTLGAEMLLEMGKSPTGQSATLGELLAVHLAHQEYAATTRADMQLVVDALPDDVTAWRVRSVEPVVVEAMYRRLKRDGWTPHRVRKLHVILGSAWNRAVKYKWATTNVIRDVDTPTVVTREVVAPDAVTVRKVLAAATGDVAAFLRLSGTTGARRGELCGLQWADLDLELGQVVIRRSVAYVAGTQEPVVNEGKTGRRGHRVLGLDPASVTMLKALRVKAVEKALKAYGNTAPVWVFSHDAGQTPWRGDYISREFKRACTRAKVTGLKLHSFRHYVATTMLAEGDAPTTVSGRLGHASSATTLGTYAHFVPSKDEVSARRLGAALDA